jgi:hypothetical protein
MTATQSFVPALVPAALPEPTPASAPVIDPVIAAVLSLLWVDETNGDEVWGMAPAPA